MKTMMGALQLAAAMLVACESADVVVTSVVLDAGPLVFGDVANGKDTARPDGAGTVLRECASDLDCRSGTAPCMAASCEKGLCVVAPMPADAPCDDLDPCTVQTTCRSGACLGSNVCVGPVEFWPYYYVPPYPLQPSRPL